MAPVSRITMWPVVEAMTLSWGRSEADMEMMFAEVPEGTKKTPVL